MSDSTNAGEAANEFQEKAWKPLLDKVKDDGFVSYLAKRDAAFK